MQRLIDSGQGIGWATRVVIAGVCLVLASGTARAQSTSAVDPAPRDASRAAAATGRHTNRLYIGMWTTHLKDPAIVLDNNWLVGVSYRGYFGATYLNSFDRRAFAGGLQRTLVGAEGRYGGASLGYRLGVVTGYDGRFMRIARHTPVMPLVQPFVTVDVWRVGVEVSYTFVVVSVAASYRF